MSYLLAFSASFVYVALRAAQQLNVVHRRWKWVMPCSFAMAAADVWLITYIVQAGYNFLAIGCLGLGAGLGAMASMYLIKEKTNGNETTSAG